MNGLFATGPWALDAEHTGELVRFRRLLESAEGQFALILARYNQPGYRDGVIQSVNGVVVEANQFGDFLAFEAWLEQHGQESGPVHLVGLDSWLHHDAERPEGLERLLAFNLHRDGIARRCRRPLVLWLLEHQAQEFARRAVDAWEWRAGVFDFTRRYEPSGLDLPARVDHSSASREERELRIAEIREFLEKNEAVLPERERAVLWDELGGIYESIGEWNLAIDAYQITKTLCEQIDDRYGIARIRVRMAYIFRRRGESDLALEELRKALVVFDILGAMRSRVVAQASIADILQERGQLDKALRLHQEEVLPVLEKLGDIHEAAVIQGRIADILQISGLMDEALHIRLEKQLPVFMRLGDVRSQALTQGRIADIFELFGRLDEALHIRQEELLIYQRLGDIREKAVVLFKIARIELERGQYSHAFEHLAEAYEISLKLQGLDGLAAIGENYGQLVIQKGERDRGLDILQTALDAATKLGQNHRVQRLRQAIQSAHESQNKNPE